MHRPYARHALRRAPARPRLLPAMPAGIGWPTWPRAAAAFSSWTGERPARALARATLAGFLLTGSALALGAVTLLAVGLAVESFGTATVAALTCTLALAAAVALAARHAHRPTRTTSPAR